MKYYTRIMLIIYALLLPLQTQADKTPISRALQEQTQETGKLLLEFTTPKDKTLKNIAITMENDGQIDRVVQEMNQQFVLPIDIKIRFADAPGPEYTTADKTITMSYDFILYLSELYLKQYPHATDKELVRFAERATTFFLYHELAHALIDVYNLPIVSNEETAADNLAAIIALEYTDDGYNITMDTADLFDMLDRRSKSYSADDLWDEHALDSQRFYNIVCLTYGRYPDKVLKELKSLKNKKLLAFIDEKGDNCKDTYKQQLNGWVELLDIHFTPQ